MTINFRFIYLISNGSFLSLVLVNTATNHYKEFYVLLPYIIYVMESGRFSQYPAFLSRVAKERDKKYSVKSP
jgi:hypothetical protein